MICPVCGSDNLTGAEVCDNCGADLGGTGVPQAASSFQSRLLGEHLDDLGRAGAGDRHARTRSSARRSRRCTTPASTACWSSTDGKLVGIFTDRDAVVRVAGKLARGVAHRRRHDARPGHAAPRRPDRGRDPQDGGRRVPPHPDRRERPADRGRDRARRLPPPRGGVRMTHPRRGPRPGPDLAGPARALGRGRRRRADAGRRRPPSSTARSSARTSRSST